MSGMRHDIERWLRKYAAEQLRKRNAEGFILQRYLEEHDPPAEVQEGDVRQLVDGAVDGVIKDIERGTERT